MLSAKINVGIRNDHGCALYVAARHRQYRADRQSFAWFGWAQEMGTDSFMKKIGMALVCALGAMTMSVTAGPALAQSNQVRPQLDDRLTLAELAGTWVEPETLSDDNGINIFGTENIVEIKPDGSFADGLDMTFKFANIPEYDGTYRISTSGRVIIAGDNITWATETAEVLPIFPSNVSDEKRAMMEEFAELFSEGMTGSETYPIVSYDGNEMVMNAGPDSQFDEYSMVRR
jgi:hypothetical protein